MRVPLVYRDGPVFGLDIGNRTVKLAQVQKRGHKVSVVGYGYGSFAPDAIIEGIIADHEVLAAAINPLLKSLPAGKITARKVAAALPVSKVFIRTLTLPAMNDSDLDQAVRLEAEQYVPVPLADLCLDYEVIEHVPVTAGKEEQINVLMVAAPRAIVDSYVQLFDLLRLELDTLEVGLAAIARTMSLDAKAQNGTLLMDFGSHSADLAVYDQTVRLTGTVAVGSDDLTQTLAKTLGITADQANEIKYKFGLGPSDLQPKIVAAIETQLKSITAEMKKMIKYYTDRGNKTQPINQIALSGGGASMPGLVEYLNSQLKLPIVIANPWANLELGHLSAPPKLEAPMYTTAVGLALREVHRD